MMKNKAYSNGQKTFEQVGEELTYFFKNGKIKAEGTSINGINGRRMEILKKDKNTALGFDMIRRTS